MDIIALSMSIGVVGVSAANAGVKTCSKIASMAA